MRALLVANPAATTTTSRVRDVLVRALSSELKVDVVETTHRGHARELAAQARTDGFDAVVSLGGDGTVNEVVNGLLTHGPGPGVPALAVVPGGSTNVFARGLGLAREPIEATGAILEALRAGRTRRISLGSASAQTPAGWTDARWFVFAAGLGFDADVVARVEAARAQGRRASNAVYVRAGVRAFFLSTDRLRPSMTLHVPGEAPVDGLFLCLVSNVSPWTYLGDRPIRPSPEASFDTGLDVFALRRLGALRMLGHLHRAMAAQPESRGRGLSRWHDLPEVTLTAGRPQAWQLDGDHLGSATGLRLRHVHQALEVIV